MDRLLCADLDRTLIPNGAAPESAGARRLLARFIARTGLRLAYVTGRDRGLLEEAIVTWALPWPEYAVTDVGTTILCRENGEWQPLPGWRELLDSAWQGRSWRDVHGPLCHVPGLRLQAENRQARHKLSYFCDADLPAALVREVEEILVAAGIAARIVTSVDDEAGQGLLDVLPQPSGKLGAIRFLLEHEGFGPENTVFAGDSGNDLDVLESGMPSVLVANAHADVRRAVAGRANVYTARGLAGLNGNYAAGVLEGMVHYWPEAHDIFTDLVTGED